MKLFSNKNITPEILKQVEDIGCNEEMLPIYYDYESLYSELNINKSYLIAVIDKEDNVLSFLVLSFLVLTINNNGTVHIKSICIHPSYKRYKLGTHMLDYLKKNYNTISLYVQTVNSAAFNFYKKNGFEVVEELDDYYKTLNDKGAYCMIYRS
jgi:ribosomal protein S18 acetylase RimI-like enzyme